MKNSPDSWINRPLLGFDTETTGVQVSEDRIVTAALIRRDSGQDTQITWLADPKIPIPDTATAVHGITTEYAQLHGRPSAEVIDEVAEKIISAWKEDIPVVAFNAAYDLQILNAELHRNGLADLTERFQGKIGPVLDPLVMDRALERYRKGKRTLTDLCAVYELIPEQTLHVAEADVTATLDILQAQCRKYPVLVTRSLPDMMAWQRESHREWAESLNSWLIKKGRTNLAETFWPLP